MSVMPAATSHLATSGGDAQQHHPPLECTLRLPLPDAASAAVLATVLAAEPAVEGTTKTVEVWWAGDASGCTVAVTIACSAGLMRPLRSAIGATLEQAKLSVRTMRVYPPLPPSS